MSKLQEVMDAAREVTPIAERNGTKILNYQDYATLASQRNIEEKNGELVDTGDRTINPDGTIGKSRTPFTAVNESKVFDNRYRIKGKIGPDREMQVVIDERIMNDLQNGRELCAKKQVPCYCIKKNEEGVYYLDRMIMVSDVEFMAEFTEKLNPTLAKELWMLFESAGADVPTADTMPI